MSTPPPIADPFGTQPLDLDIVDADHQEVAGVHPYADKFPMLEADYQTVLESIRENGQRRPIDVTPDGLILDGRTRYRACRELGIPCVTQVYEGTDLAEFVIDANVRRDLSTGSKAMAVALVLVEAKCRVNGRWKRGSVAIGESANSDWRARLKEAGFILDHAPDLAEPVVNGTLAIDTARKKAEQRRDAERKRLEEDERRQAEEAEAKAFLEENDPELAARVDGTDLETYAEARAVWEKRNREKAAKLKAEEDRKKKAEADARAARSHKFGAIADALLVLGGHGRVDTSTVMEKFDPTELDPPELIRYYSPENIRRAVKFATELAAYMEGKQE